MYLKLDVEWWGVLIWMNLNFALALNLVSVWKNTRIDYHTKSDVMAASLAHLDPKTAHDLMVLNREQTEVQKRGKRYYIREIRKPETNVSESAASGPTDKN